MQGSEKIFGFLFSVMWGVVFAKFQLTASQPPCYCSTATSASVRTHAHTHTHTHPTASVVMDDCTKINVSSIAYYNKDENILLPASRPIDKRILPAAPWISSLA